LQYQAAKRAVLYGYKELEANETGSKTHTILEMAYEKNTVDKARFMMQHFIINNQNEHYYSGKFLWASDNLMRNHKDIYNLLRHL